MSNNEQDVQIEELVNPLNNKIEDLLRLLDEDSVRRFHNSVNISFKQMFEYIVTISNSRKPEEIGILVSAYKEMAQLYYAQYEFLLLKEILKQHNLQKDVELSFNEIDIKLEGENEDVKKAFESSKNLLKKSGESAGKKYDDLIKDFPKLMQDAIDKLRNEWQRINTIVSNGQVLNQDEKLIRSLKSVVAVAAHSVGIEAERIVIVPGNVFALSFFTYLENFAVLTIPIYSVQASWEWSIIWHELAGYKARSLEKITTIDTIRKKLDDFYNYYKIVDEAKKVLMITNAAPNVPFSQGYLIKLFSGENKDLILNDLGGFEFQFEQMMAKLPSKDRISKYEELKAQGWCVDWFKELFEDAWSVLAIGEPFLDIFEDILNRNANRDERHPPVDVRLNVAKELIKLLGDKNGVNRRPKEINPIAAKKILEFITLLIAAAREFKEPEGDNLASQQVLRQESQDIRDQISGKLRGVIQKSISNWSKEILDADDPVHNAKQRSTSFIAVLSDDYIANLISMLDEKEKEQINKKYKDLLEYEDYRELLDKPFYEVDFGTATVTDVFYRTEFIFDTAKLSSVPAEVAGGSVKYINNNVTKHTTIQFWNTAAAPGYQIE
jgi:hypothetical protein